jgi:hypothetical protein
MLPFIEYLVVLWYLFYTHTTVHQPALIEERGTEVLE